MYLNMNYYNSIMITGIILYILTKSNFKKLNLNLTNKSNSIKYTKTIQVFD